MLLSTVVLLHALVAAPAAAQDRPPPPPQTDQTVPVSRGMRLAIENDAGEVIVHTWDKDALRVQARHSVRTRINIRTAANVVNLSANGPTGSVDYDITAPAWMPMHVEGQFNYVSIEGAQSDVSIETVRGDIVLKGGSGSVTARTIEGEIQVEGMRGSLNLNSVNEGIRVTGASGDIAAETTNGSITFTRMGSKTVEAVTINGNVSYEGTLADNGRYTFTTHNGDIVMTVPETTNATFNVRTYNGEFGSSLPLKGPDRSEIKRGKRTSYTLGTGSAEVHMESFGGGIRVRRAGAARTSRDF